MYGLPRGDTCWGGRQQGGMRKLVFEQVRDSGEESLWIKPYSTDVLDLVLVIIYLDNFRISGKRIFAEQAHA